MDRYYIGINTVNTHHYRSINLRGEPKIPQTRVGPWFAWQQQQRQQRWQKLKKGTFASMLRCIGRARRIQNELLCACFTVS